MTELPVLTKVFWLDALERAKRTFIQVLIVTLPFQSFSDALFAGDWQALKTLFLQTLLAGAAAALSVVWSLISAKKPNTISPASGVVVPQEPVDTGLLVDSDLEESYHPDDLAGA